MPDIERYDHGEFCWTELATTDQDGARSFYTQLFGWEAEDVDLPDGGTYTLLRKRGRDAAAVYRMSEQEEANAPPHWNHHVSDDDLDAIATAITEAGGTVIVEPFDVMDLGRMLVAVDPTGGAFCCWQPGTRIGAEVAYEHGAREWHELMSTDLETAGDFYTSVFPWEPETLDMPTGPYTLFRYGTGNAGGLMAAPPDVPSAWTIYFHVDDCAAIVDRAKELGAGVMMGPDPVPSVGTIAWFTDPTGAVFAVIEPDPDAYPT